MPNSTSEPISKSTPITLGVVISIAVLAMAIVGFGVSWNGWAIRLESKVDTLQKTVNVIEFKSSGYRTKAEASEYHSTLGVINPEVTFPAISQGGK